jgi:Mg2+/Co2+ transporter CorB
MFVLILLCVLVAILISLSAVFSGSETALTGASRARLHQLERQGSPAAARANLLLQDPEALIGAILLANNLVNILASALATSLFIALMGEAGVLLATLIMTALVVIFAEVLPKTYAIRHADKVALKVAGAVAWLITVTRPVVRAIQGVVRFVLWAIGDRPDPDAKREEAEEELRGAIELHTDAEDEEAREARDMLRSILDLSDVAVEEVMTHRRNVAMIDIDQEAQAIVTQVVESPYTRLPLYSSDPDNIVGILHAKELLRALRAREGDASQLDIRTLAAEPWFIPSSTSLTDQLQNFRKKRAHFAVVVDEYGSFEGIITLEDILEEIVGDIDDETDVVKAAGVNEAGDGSYIVEGSVTIRDLNRQFDWTLPDDDATTVAGLVLYEAHVIPEVGQVFNVHGFTIKVLERQRLQITKLQIWPEPILESAASDDASA